MDIISKLKNDSNLRAYWAFNAGTLTDLSGNGNDLSATGSPQFTKEGLLFSGSGDFLSCSAIRSGDFTTMSCMALIKTSKPQCAVFDWRDDGSDGASMYVDLTTYMNARFQATTDIDTQTVITDYEWHTVGWTFDGTDLKMYVDGLAVDSTSGSSQTANVSGTFYVGCLRTGVSSVYDFKGIINSMVITDNSLTATEIAQLSAQLLNSKYPTKPTGKSLADTTVSNDSALTAGWNMIPVKKKIEDESGNGYYAIIYKATHEKDPVIGDTLKMEGSGYYAGINSLNRTDFNNKSWTISVLAKPSASGELGLFGTTASTPRLYFTTNYISYDDSNVATFNNTGTAGVPHLWVATYNKDTEELKTYLDGELEDTQSHAVETGFTSLALNIGTGGASTFTGNMGAVKVYLDTVKSADWVATEYNKVKNTAVTFKTDWGVQEIPATNCVEDKFLSNTPFQCSASSGSHKITTETINGQQCKVIECTSSGHLYIPSQKMASNSTEAAYGEWEFWLYYNGSADSQGFYFINSNKLAYPNTLNSYTLYLSTTYTDARILRVNGASSSTLISGGTIITGWNKIRITRDSSGVWKLWLNDTYIGTVTDNTYTTSTYFVAMMQTGNKFAYADKSGGHSIIKRPLP